MGGKLIEQKIEEPLLLIWERVIMKKTIILICQRGKRQQGKIAEMT